MRKSFVGSLKMLGLGLAGFYACLVLFNIAVWLPVHFAEKPWPYFALGNILVYFPGFFRGIQSQSGSLLSQLWEVLLAPVLVMVSGAFASFKLRHRLRFLALDFILLSSFSLMSFVVGLLANDIGRWFDTSDIESPSRFVLRFSLSVLLGLLTAVANFLPFYSLYQDSADSWARRLLSYLCTIVLPSAIVSLATAGTPHIIVGMGRTEQTLHWANTWSPSHPRPDLTFEGWILIFLPVISVCTIATLSAIFTPVLLNWPGSSAAKAPLQNK